MVEIFYYRGNWNETNNFLGIKKMERGSAKEAPFDPGRPPGGENVY
jgi:hypothetical protein